MRSPTPLLAIISFIPITLTALAVFFMLPDTVPLHIGFGGITRYGSKFEAFWVGGLLTGFCLLMTIGFYYVERLYAARAIHGTGVKGARIALVSTIGIFVILSIASTIFWMS